jgi:hypothetical protein
MTDERIVGHLREGLAAGVRRRPGSGGLRVELDLDLVVEGLATAPKLPVMNLAGPGDVARLDPGQIVLQYPAPDAPDAVQDLFAFVEFARGDLPWLFSPFGPDAQDVVMPWLALLVLPVAAVALRPGQPNDVIEAPAAHLPAWASVASWAHAQFAPSRGVGSARSRLICPRRLDPATDYLACLVPTYRAGVQAGLGEVPEGTAAALLAPAWDSTSSSPVTLPVYRHWRFSTGINGSFGALVRRLTPAAGLTEVGSRQIDITAPGAGMASLARRRRIALDGALAPVGRRAQAADSGFRRRLLPLLDRPGQLSAPSYGCWHAGAKPTGPARQRAWLKALNLDARRRVAAALGTAVVQRHQDAFMAAIWAQAGEVEAANRTRRRGQMAVATAQSMMLRRLRRFNVDETGLLLFAAPALARTSYGEMQSFRGLVARSCLSPATLGAPLLRLLRANGPVQRRLSRRTDGQRVRPGDVLTDVLAGALRDRPAAPAGARFRTLSQLGQRRILPGRNFGAGPILPGRRFGSGLVLPQTPLGDVLQRLTGLLNQTAEAACTALPTDTLPALRRALDPGLTVPRRILAHQKVDPSLNIADQGLDPILVAPRLPVATMPYLTELSPDWLLPGMGNVPPDSLTAFTPNPAFIEAFLAGMNHEIGREMLWRGFPTDQRGTVFDSFWRTDDRAIPPLHGWRRALGRHATGSSASGAVILLRAELVRRFPDVAVFLHPALQSNGQWQPDGAIGAPRSIAPTFVRRIGEDQRLMGFPLSVEDLRGRRPGGPEGYFLVFQEPAQALRFGPPSPGPAGYLTLQGGPVAVANQLRRNTARYFVPVAGLLA